MYHYAYLQGIFFLINSVIALLIGLKLLHSGRKNKNTAVIFLSFAAFAITLDWLTEGVAIVFFQGNSLITTYAFLVFGQLFIHLSMSFILMVVVMIGLTRASIYFGLIPLFVGVLVIISHVVYSLQGNTLEYTQTGFVNLPFNTVGEFFTFLTVVTVTGLFGYSYFSQTRLKEIKLRGILFSVGIIIVGISATPILNVHSPLVFYILNIASVIGMLLILLGVYMKKY